MDIERYTHIHDWLMSGIEMVSEKAEKICREEKELSLCELGQLSDIIKDCAKALKSIVVAEDYMSDGKIKKY